MNYLEQLKLLGMLITHADSEEREAKYFKDKEPKDVNLTKFTLWNDRLKKLVHFRDSIQEEAIKHYIGE